MDHHNIVRQFQNLRVYSNSRLVSMDELVQDLANALEESTSPVKNSNHSVTTKRPYKKRKGKKRRTLLLDCGNMSETSASSYDEALRDYFENFTRKSDSDDDIGKITRLSMPLNSNFMQSVESDSVNESIISPLRPQRRRKKYKAMATDSESETCCMKPPLGITDHKSKTHKIRCMSNMKTNDVMFGVEEEVHPGKRKRSSKSRAEYLTSFDQSKNSNDQNSMETGSNIESSSGLSSSESDGLLTNDEAREADDEHSDFYYESGPACGIPGIIRWWENDSEDIESESERQKFQQILTGSFEHIPKSSQLAFRARVTRMMAKTGRPIRFGRRKLKEKEPKYTLSRFLKERQKWNDIQGFPSGFKSNGNGDQKRFRKTPPLQSPIEEGVVGGNADPIPESNIGNRMLQDMGWVPGNGLGSEMVTQSFRRPKRQGLGCSSHPYIRSMDS
ncbi:G patch domain-containing protein 2-like [Saccostrea cucullata]|uniref:G patch domain-containing protein 2-like n=1 Tax=Saccostrea cuccullata TaxID=36930 RepID=UPI002ED65B15